MQSTNGIPYGYCQCGCGQRTPISKKTSTKEGRIKGEPTRYLPHHGITPASVRFWKYVSPGPFHECWLWHGLTNPAGYGRIGGERSERMILAHRLSWEIHFGPIPANLFVLHRCDVRHCVNPYHLFLGTYADNTADMQAKGRSGIPGAKLTKTQVVEVRDLAAQGIAQAKIARRFEISEAAISNIVLRKTWQHVP